MTTFYVDAVIRVPVEVDGKPDEYDEAEIISFAQDLIFDSEFYIQKDSLVVAGHDD